MLACRAITKHICGGGRSMACAADRLFSIASQSWQRPTCLHEFTEDELMLKDAGICVRYSFLKLI